MSFQKYSVTDSRPRPPAALLTNTIHFTKPQPTTSFFLDTVIQVNHLHSPNFHGNIKLKSDYERHSYSFRYLGYLEEGQGEVHSIG